MIVLFIIVAKIYYLDLSCKPSEATDIFSSNICIFVGAMDNKTFLSKIAKSTGRTAEETGRLADAFMTVLAESATAGREVVLPGVGRFYPILEEETVVVDRITGKRLLLPPEAVMKFECAPSLVNKLKDGRQNG